MPSEPAVKSNNLYDEIHTTLELEIFIPYHSKLWLNIIPTNCIVVNLIVMVLTISYLVDHDPSII